jgi:pimeloyl-ACP methyl ester carboxylesterase
MEFSIVPYEGDSPFRPLPYLNGKLLVPKNVFPLEEVLFFYDSFPENSASADAASPIICLVHGLGDEADSWRHVIPLLAARGFRVLAPDLPGFGRSVPAGKIGLKNHAAAVLTLLETVAPDPETQVFLAGSSMGAAVAEMAAFKKPERIRGLVLIDGSIPGGPKNPGFAALVKMIFSRKWYRAYIGNPEDAWASLYPYYADLDAMPEEDKHFLRRRVMTRVESRAQEQAYFSTRNSVIWTSLTASSRFARKIARLYKGKILLLWGERDRIIPIASAEAFRALRDGIDLKIIPGAGHLPQQEKPAETVKYISDFCGSCLELSTKMTRKSIFQKTQEIQSC